MKRLLKFLKDEEGAIAMEYGLLAAFIALVIVIGATALGKNLNTFFGNIATEVTTWVIP
jgi:pilus assembly protein Flp/PilA